MGKLLNAETGIARKGNKQDMKKLILTAALAAMALAPAPAKDWPGFTRGMGIGGWLTNYKRFNVLPEDKRLLLTEGDFEHFDRSFTRSICTGRGSSRISAAC